VGGGAPFAALHCNHLARELLKCSRSSLHVQMQLHALCGASGVARSLWTVRMAVGSATELAPGAPSGRGIAHHHRPPKLGQRCSGRAKATRPGDRARAVRLRR